MKMASNCWNVHQHVQLWQSLVVVKISLVPFLLRENETKFVNGEKICINSWNVHQLVGIIINVLELRLKISSTVGKCINLLEL
jgi:hypothetical protein